MNLPYPDAEAAIAMPPARLAGALLADLFSRYPNVLFHRGNELGALQDRHGLEMANALAEAWAWLERECLIVHSTTNHDAGVFRVSRAGAVAANPAAFEEFFESTLVRREMLHPLIANRAWDLYLSRDYDTAVFAAFKALEISVAQRSRCEGTGVPLMRAAFHKVSGPLRDPAMTDGEAEGVSNLFAGAFGVIRNTAGHKYVTYDGPTEPAEMLIVASHLMRMLDRLYEDWKLRHPFDVESSNGA